MKISLRVHAWITLLFGSWICAGCAQSLPPPTDAADAQAALATALDAWQRGATPERLRERTPPIQFTDLHWDKGAQLVKYEIATAEPRGLGVRITVKLALKEKDGRQRETTTVYTAETQPRIVIVPEF